MEEKDRPSASTPTPSLSHAGPSFSIGHNDESILSRDAAQLKERKKSSPDAFMRIIKPFLRLRSPISITDFHNFESLGTSNQIAKAEPEPYSYVSTITPAHVVLKQHALLNINAIGRKRLLAASSAHRVVSSHENISTLYTTFREASRFYLIMERVPGPSVGEFLRDREKGFSEHFALSIVLQVGQALSYMHGKGIVHRDVRPGHILFNYPAELVSEERIEVKLIDFSNACAVDSRHPVLKGGIERVGFLEYKPPEFLLDVSYEPMAADVYSLGVTLFELISKQMPFRSGAVDYSEDAYRKMHTLPCFDDECWKGVSEGCQLFIKDCLNRNRELRPSAGAAVSRLEKLVVKTMPR